jgi:hypothetical protein
LWATSLQSSAVDHEKITTGSVLVRTRLVAFDKQFEFGGFLLWKVPVVQ